MPTNGTLIRGKITKINDKGFQIDGEWFNKSQYPSTIDPDAKVGDEVELEVDAKHRKFIQVLKRANGHNDAAEHAPTNGGTEKPKAQTAPNPTPRNNGDDQRTAWEREKNSYILYESSINQAVGLLGYRIQLGQVPKDADLRKLVMEEAEAIASFIRSKVTGKAVAASPMKEAAPAALERKAVANPSQDRISNETLSKILETGKELKRSQKSLNLDALKLFEKENVSLLTEAQGQEYHKHLLAQLTS